MKSVILSIFEKNGEKDTKLDPKQQNGTFLTNHTENYEKCDFEHF